MGDTLAAGAITLRYVAVVPALLIVAFTFLYLQKGKKAS
jgi:hypothetical protein